MLLAVWTAGCASSRRTQERADAIRGAFLPKPPDFVNGPMAVLLTNADGFGARVVMESRFFSNRVESVSGELLGRSGKLLFVPETAAPKGKHPRAADVSFIWDVNEGDGYLLSEALQGYAPMRANVRVTNLVCHPVAGGSVPEKFDGHPCQLADAVVSSDDGSTAAFQLWRCTDLKEFPIRIAASSNSTSSVLSFSQIRLEVPASDLFLPPESFTKYNSPEAMMNELLARQQNIRRKPSTEPVSPEQLGSQDERRYRGR
jgi:hypothetical protein